MRPPPFFLSPTALFTLPYRLCNPPPAAGNVRSCKVTPLIKITLDDVLNKRHLPPLTLKDFEEWLIFVDGCPQYLYFILWLKEYESRYAAWLLESGCALPASSSLSVLSPDTPTTPDLSYVNLIPSSPPLALFFTRAKQTFLDPTSQSPYALGPAALAALATANAPSTHSLTPSIPHFTLPDDDDSGLPAALSTQPHPHPSELVPLATYARTALKDSLQRFAETACHNVGTRRAWCGIAGGTFITLALGILPALVAFFFAPSRWWRLVGWPGCWLGATIITSSFHGICMMIYVFGDLRQLRSFELARPSISEPHAIARARPRLRSFFTREHHDPSACPSGSLMPPSPVPPPPPPPRPAFVPPKPHAKPKPSSASETSTGTPVVHFKPDTFRLGVTSDATGTSTSTGLTVEEGDKEEGDDFGIEISPAFYPEGCSGAAATVEYGEGEEQKEGVSVGGVGRVMRWVLGKRSSGAEVLSSDKSQAPSHAGTFGVRSWSGRGGLGSLPGDPEKCVVDLEKGVAEKESEVTAEFITYEYGAHDKPVAAFDFDKLPTRCVVSDMDTDTDSTATPMPAPPPTLPPSAPPPIPLPPPPRPTEPDPQPFLAAKPPLPPADRQWWDTCPQHPAVEASLARPQVKVWIPATPTTNTMNMLSPPTDRDARASWTSSFDPSSSDVHSRRRMRDSPPKHASSSSWRTRFRRVTAVPAFGPLTRVLSPVVSRGQWEIVVRSAAVAALCAWVLVGCLVAAPVLV